MGVRDSMNRHWRVTAAAACSAIAIVALALVFQARRGNPSEADDLAARKSWYSTDDGKTWFADDATKVPPFTKDGKLAYRAHVYRAPDGTEFVGFLERYTPAGKRAVEAAWALPPEQRGTDPTMAGGSDHTEVKKPGQRSWIPVSSPMADQIYHVVSPKGHSDGLKMVDPN